MSTDKNKLIPELRFPEFEEPWKIITLSEVVDVFRGGTFSKADMDENGTESCIHYGELFTKYNEVISNIFSKTNKSDGFRSQAGDILMPSSDVTPNGLAKASAIIIDNVVLGGDMNIIRPKTDINSIFLSYLLNHSKIEIIKLVSGTTVKHIYPSQIINCQIPIITCPKEQQKIASCLSSLDEVIAAQSQKLATLKDHKKGLMQNLFPTNSITNDELEITNVPNYRFPEFLEDGDWVEKDLGEVFSIFQGFAFSSKDNVLSGTRWLKIADVGIQKMKEDNPTYLPSSFKETYQRFLVKKGDFVMALTRPILNMELKIAPVDNVFHNALLNQRVGKIVTSNNSSFVYYLTQTTKMVGNINKNIAGNEPPNLSFQQIEDIDIFLPKEIKEQQKIASCLSSLDELITAQTEKIAQLKLHKKGLMQSLFPNSITN
jgi:type I restriction enzyme S subunit